MGIDRLQTVCGATVPQVFGPHLFIGGTEMTAGVGELSEVEFVRECRLLEEAIGALGILGDQLMDRMKPYMIDRDGKGPQKTGGTTPIVELPPGLIRLREDRDHINNTLNQLRSILANICI